MHLCIAWTLLNYADGADSRLCSGGSFLVVDVQAFATGRRSVTVRHAWPTINRQRPLTWLYASTTVTPSPCTVAASVPAALPLLMPTKLPKPLSRVSSASGGCSDMPAAGIT